MRALISIGLPCENLWLRAPTPPWLGLVLAGFLVLQAVDVCLARTLRVEKGGSGDYVEIQAAVDASAPEDTVLVGPGRYDETRFHQLPGGSGYAIAVVQDWPLTVLGTDSARVFLGPSHPDSIAVPEPVGVVVAGSSASGTHIEGLTFENLYDGVIANAGAASVQGCAFRGNEQAGVVGIDIVDPGGMTVVGCTFERGTRSFVDFGVLAFTSRNIRTVDCRFLDVRHGVEHATVLGGLVDRCSFESGWLGVQMEQGATGEIRDCEFIGLERVPIAIALQATAGLVGNHVGAGAWRSLSVSSLCHVEGEGNRFEPGTYETAEFAGNATANLSGNAFHHGAGPTVRLGSYLEGMPNQLDLAGNWWGTTDRDSIDAWIWDGNDDPSIKAVVEYEPILDGPLAGEAKSFSDLKALFSPDH
jgi:hypothetical protein